MSCLRFSKRLLLYSSPLLLLVGLIVTFVGYLNSVPTSQDCDPKECRQREQEVRHNLSNSRIIGPALIGVSAGFFLFGKLIAYATASNRRRGRGRQSNVTPSGADGALEGSSNFGFENEFSPPPPYREAIRMQKPTIQLLSVQSIPEEPPPSYDDASVNLSRSNTGLSNVEVNQTSEDTEAHVHDEVINDVVDVIENVIRESNLVESLHPATSINIFENGTELDTYRITTEIPRFPLRGEGNNSQTHRTQPRGDGSRNSGDNGMNSIAYYISFE